MSDDVLRKNFNNRLNKGKKSQSRQSYDELDANDLLEQKKRSLRKIGVNLKEDQGKILENDLISEDSQTKKNFKTAMK